LALGHPLLHDAGEVTQAMREAMSNTASHIGSLRTPP